MTSVIKVDNIQNSSGTQAINIHSSGLIIPSAGGIIQTQYTQFTGTDTQSISSQTDTALDNLSVSITPTSTSSIIKLEAQVFFEPNNTASEYNNMFFFYRDNTKLGHAASETGQLGLLILQHLIIAMILALHQAWLT